MPRQPTAQGLTFLRSCEGFGSVPYIEASFDKGGVAGLVPRKRGPRGPHKLQGQALAFLQQQLVAGEPVRARELATLVRQKFDPTSTPERSREQSLEKKLPDEQCQLQFAESSMVILQMGI